MNQGYLFPPILRKWLPDGDLGWFIIDAVEQMDLGKIYAKTISGFLKYISFKNALISMGYPYLIPFEKVRECLFIQH